MMEILEPLDLLPLDSQGLGDQFGRLQRRLRDGRVNHLQPFAAQLLGRRGGLRQPLLVQRNIQAPLNPLLARRSRSSRDESTRSVTSLNPHFLS